MTEYCDMVDCPEEALVLIPGEKHVCIIHAMQYQKDLAERMIREGTSLL